MEKVPISQRIKEGLALRGMKQIDLSRKTGISRSMITEYLKGKYEPRQDNIYSIAKALNVNVAWLMGFDVKRDCDHKVINKNIFAKNLNLMMIIDLRAFGECIYDTIQISKERMDALLKGESAPSFGELKSLSNHLDIPNDVLLTVDLTSENGKFHLNKWAENKKEFIKTDNEFILENCGQKEARKNIIYEFFFHLDNLNLNALINLYNYITDMVLDENNLDEDKLGFQYILYEDDDMMPIKKGAFEKLKEDTDSIKRNNDKIFSILSEMFKDN